MKLSYRLLPEAVEAARQALHAGHGSATHPIAVGWTGSPIQPTWWVVPYFDKRPEGFNCVLHFPEGLA